MGHTLSKGHSPTDINKKRNLVHETTGQSTRGIIDIIGEDETQLSEEGECALQHYKKHCTKNAGHLQFIAIENFRLTDLPEGYRDRNLYEVIKLVADLTVRVDVRMISPNRPDFWPGTTSPFPFSDKRGSTSLRTGSGQMSVFMLIDGVGYDGLGGKYNALGRKYERDYKRCPCERCQFSDHPSTVWWEIIVLTAVHVVFDELEAKHTTCRLFYDSDDSPLVKFEKVTLEYANVKRDWCSLKYVTCDPELGNKLYNMMEERFELGKKVWKRHKNGSRGKLTFIVSHPHGCTKQVSLGHWVDNRQMSEFNKDFNFTKLTYTTCTCKGSSGAMVHCVGFFGANHVHSGTVGHDLNYSSVGYCRDQTILKQTTCKNKQGQT